VNIKLLNALGPAIPTGPKGNSDAGHRDLSNALFELCVKALKLALKFRETKTKYGFEVLEDHSPLNGYDRSLYEPMGIEGNASQDDPNARVFCTMFGALVKTKENAGTAAEKRVVLLPAHVIVGEEPKAVYSQQPPPRR